MYTFFETHAITNLNLFQLRQIRPTPGLGHVEGKVPKGLKNYDEDEAEKAKAKFTTSDYVVPPKVPQLQLGPSIGPSRPYKEQEGKPLKYDC